MLGVEAAWRVRSGLRDAGLGALTHGAGLSAPSLPTVHGGGSRSCSRAVPGTGEDAGGKADEEPWGFPGEDRAAFCRAAGTRECWGCQEPWAHPSSHIPLLFGRPAAVKAGK